MKLSVYQRQLFSSRKQQTYYKTITNIQQYSTKFSTFQQQYYASHSIYNIIITILLNNNIIQILKISYVSALLLMNIWILETAPGDAVNVLSVILLFYYCNYCISEAVSEAGYILSIFYYCIWYTNRRSCSCSPLCTILHNMLYCIYSQL